jgi:hypothetical protein
LGAQRRDGSLAQEGEVGILRHLYRSVILPPGSRSHRSGGKARGDKELRHLSGVGFGQVRMLPVRDPLVCRRSARLHAVAGA